MIKLAYNLYFNKFYSNLFIVIQLAIFIGFANYAICANNYMYDGCNYSYTLGNAAYFSSIKLINNDNIDYDLLEENNCILEIIPSKINVYDTCISQYGEKTLNYYKSYLKKGKWITDVESKENTINCLIVDDTSMLGKTIQKKYNKKTYNFYVCGVLSKKCKDITINSINSTLTPGDIFKNYNLIYKNIICDCKDFLGFDDLQNNCAMVYYDSDFENVERYLSTKGCTLTMENLRDNIKESVTYLEVKVYSYVAYTIGILGLVSMICMLILNVDGNRNDFEIYLNLGLQRKYFLGICFWYAFFMFIFISMVSFVCFLIWRLITISSINVILSYKNIIFNLASILVILIIIILVFFSRLYRKVDYNE